MCIRDRYGYAVALDTGGAIKGNKIDVMFSSHSLSLIHIWFILMKLSVFLLLSPNL